VTLAAVAAAGPFGVEVVGVAVAGATLLLTVGYLAVLARALGLRTSAVAGALAPALVGAAAMAAVLIAARAPLSGLAPLARLAAFAGLGTAAYAAVVGAVAGRRLAADARVFR
jgi:hypothetical protein